MLLTNLAMILLQDATPDSGNSTVRLITGALAVVLVIIIIMRRKAGKGKKSDEEEF